MAKDTQASDAVQDVRLEELFQQAPGFMAMCAAAEHRFLFTNETFKALVGRDDLVGKRVADALPEFERQGFTDILDQVYASGEPFHGREMPIWVKPQGEVELAEHFVDFVYQPILDAKGEVAGIFLAGHDVTKQKKAREEVQLLQSDLIHISRVSAMGTMASTLAHELNQPLTAISTYLSGCQRMIAAGENVDLAGLSRAIELARGNAHRAAEVIRRLREMTVRGKTLKLRFNLADAAREAASLALIGTQEKVIARTLDIPDGLMADGDKTQVQQVLLNLIRNAAEAMAGKDRQELTIRAREEKGVAHICVCDTGDGVSEEARASLFAPFISTKPG